MLRRSQNYGFIIFYSKSTTLYRVSSKNNSKVRRKKKGSRFSSGFLFCVEHSGLEPLTSTLPVSRSSRMS